MATAAVEQSSTPTSNNPFDNIIRPEALAARIGCSGRTLYRWHVQGKGPTRRREGHFIFYVTDEVDAWLKGKTQTRRGRRGR